VSEFDVETEWLNLKVVGENWQARILAVRGLILSQVAMVDDLRRHGK
jgi:hypothetical protein